MPFLNIGCKRIIGVDMSRGKIENANEFFSNHPKKKNIKFILADIYDVDDIGQFDIIITRDVLEHIHGQEWFMQFVAPEEVEGLTSQIKLDINSQSSLINGMKEWEAIEDILDEYECGVRYDKAMNDSDSQEDVSFEEVKKALEFTDLDGKKKKIVVDLPNDLKNVLSKL